MTRQLSVPVRSQKSADSKGRVGRAGGLGTMGGRVRKNKMIMQPHETDNKEQCPLRRWDGKREPTAPSIASPGRAGQPLRPPSRLGRRPLPERTLRPACTARTLTVHSYLINEITSTSPSSIITVDINLITLAWRGIGLLYVLLIFNFRETSAGGESMERAFYYRQH